jgi:hypothetical protein
MRPDEGPGALQGAQIFRKLHELGFSGVGFGNLWLILRLMLVVARNRENKGIRGQAATL